MEEMNVFVICFLYKENIKWYLQIVWFYLQCLFWPIDGSVFPFRSPVSFKASRKCHSKFQGRICWGHIYSVETSL